MSMPRAAASFLTSCSDSSKGWRGRRPTLNWRSEARARACGSMSRLACAGCGAEDQIFTMVQPAITSAASEVLAGLVDRRGFRRSSRSVDAAPDGDGWLHEIKYDGYRMHARLDRGA